MIIFNSDLQSVAVERKIDSKIFTSLAYATENVETAEHVTRLDSHSDVKLYPVVIALPNNRLVLLNLDNETYTDFEYWVESESVLQCDGDEDIPDDIASVMNLHETLTPST